jgi:hypothetical protein
MLQNHHLVAFPELTTYFEIIFDPSDLTCRNRPAPVDARQKEGTSIKFWHYRLVPMLTKISRMDIGPFNNI